MKKDNDDIKKIDEQIKLLKNENIKTTTLSNNETVITEITDPEDENHVINIDYINSEVLENTKELKTLKDINVNEEVDKVDEKFEKTNGIKITDKKNKNGKIILIVLGIIILILVFIVILLLVFKGKDNDKKVDRNNNDTEEVKKELTKDQMIKIINEYGLNLEKEIASYYAKNNFLPEFSVINNLVIMDNEVVCHVHEIYEDKKIYLTDCMVDYVDVEHTYGVKQEVKEEVVDNNNVKVYVNKHNKEVTLDEPKDIENYILYSSNVDGDIHGLTLVKNTSYLIYYDNSGNNPYGVLYNYILGKKAFYKIDYKYISVLRNSSSEYLTYAIIYTNDNKGKIYNLITGDSVSEEYDTIHQVEVSKERIVVVNNNKSGLINYVTGNEIIPLEYDSISSSGNSIIGLKGDTAFIFDDDGNQYLTNISKIGFHRSMVVDRYVFSGKKLYNINGNAVCEFDLEYPILTKYGVITNDNVIYHIESNNEDKCLVYNVSSKECSVVTEDECQTYK